MRAPVAPTHRTSQTPTVTSETEPEFTADGEGATLDLLYRRLRTEILECRIPPGAILSQVRLAKQYGVSRTPLREALRMLEREGLIESEHNRRVKVSGFSIEEFEQIAAERVLLETLVTRVSIRETTPLALDELARHLQGMRDAAAADDYDAYSAAHTRFHLGLTSRGGPRMAESLQRLTDLATRYRWIYRSQVTADWSSTIPQHETLLVEVRTLDPERAGNAVGRYLAQRALEMIRAVDPEYDAALLIQAMQMSVSDRAA